MTMVTPPSKKREEEGRKRNEKEDVELPRLPFKDNPIMINCYL
jgi:hypothetical protein